MAPTKGDKKTAEKKPSTADKEAIEGREEAFLKEGVSSAGIEKKKKKSQKSVETYKIYLFKVLKQVHPDYRHLWKSHGDHEIVLSATSSRSSLRNRLVSLVTIKTDNHFS
ncbi:unnamed protein product [Lactuca virosa]|uniref:Histone H2B n=1 Tax=Lactuca virosa TaxID=75947 RepID=A0AAU9NKI5_9ASTR|nr:unnamed protein product [Lactuca virosa]